MRKTKSVEVGQIWKDKLDRKFKIYSKSDVNMTTIYYCEYIKSGSRWGMGSDWFDGADYQFVK